MEDDLEEEKNQSKAGLVFDVVFELALCFIVLIVAMVLSRNDVIGGPYVLDFARVAKMIIAVVAVTVFLAFITAKSTKDMNESMEMLKKEGFLGSSDSIEGDVE